jgi:formylglycine-generating enzyme required for sulfatase activity
LEHANTLDGRVKAPSPVGAYPSGMAVSGALDLAGNVWEWTHSLYQSYPYRTNNGREDRFAPGQRTLRGGAWDDNLGGARVSCRGRDRPVAFGADIGVRVVVGPVLLSSAS